MDYQYGAGMTRLHFLGIILLLTGWGCATPVSCPPAPEPIASATGLETSASIHPAGPAPAASDPVLLQKVQAQEKRIKELTTQLRLLKSIDFQGKKERAVKSCGDHPC